MKYCKGCEANKNESAFYASSGNLCKRCFCDRSNLNKATRRAQYVAYEYERARRADRKRSMAECQRRRRKVHPERVKAWATVYRAVRNGTLVKGPCGVCGSKVMVEAHHEDYRKPLEVKWRCFKHHREVEHGQVVSFSPKPV